MDSPFLDIDHSKELSVLEMNELINEQQADDVEAFDV